MTYLLKDAYTLLDIPGQISSESWIQREIERRFTVLITECDHDYVLNLYGVRHVSSALLRLILALQRTASGLGAHLFLANVRQPAWDSLIGLGVDQSVPMYPSLLDYEAEKLDPALLAA